MGNIDDVLPYLQLRDGEKLLFVKLFEGNELQIKYLEKYHEPEKFPKHLITIKKDRYEYDQFDIITNFRLIKFGLNHNYMEEDGVTPISEIFHNENLFLWVNLEDIDDFKVHFGINVVGTLGFNFFGRGRLKVKEKPIPFTGYNYEEYCQVKDILVKWFKFEPQEIEKELDNEIQKIFKFNKNLIYWMLIGLLILGILIIPITYPSYTEDPTKSFFYYSIGGLYMVYMVFFLLFNYIIHKIFKKKKKEKMFLTLMKLDFAWHLGPAISAVVFVFGFGILLLELVLLIFIDNGFIALSIAVGFWAVVMVFAVGFDLYYRKKKKKKKIMKTKKTTDKEV
ncbi:MAG: hypothetical protein ACTSRX_02370 [Promethearchaeota archaeon]